MEIISNNKTEVNTVEVEFKVNAEEFDNAIEAAYLRKRKNIQIAGFRKGKASRKMIESQYGEGFFYEEAVNGMYQKTVSGVIDELKLDVVDIPNTEVLSLSKEEGVSFKASFTVKPEVKISGYKGINVTKEVKTVTDEDVAAELSRIADRNARVVDVTDRPVQTGDTAVFDFEGSCDGVPFEGGKAENFSLEIGSKRFVPGFEEQMVGKNIGEDFEVNITFPEDYQAEDLAGKEAVFKCKINSLKGKEISEIDDEFAKDVSEFDTLDELKSDIREKIQVHFDKESKFKLDDDLSAAVIECMDVEVPEVMYENRITDLIRDWEYKNRNYGIRVDDYLKYAGITLEQFKENFRDPAEKQTKLRLALEKIAELENISVDEETLDKHYAELAEEHKMDVEKVKGIISRESFEMDVKVEKAFDFIRDNAKIS